MKIAVSYILQLPVYSVRTSSEPAWQSGAAMNTDVPAQILHAAATHETKGF